MPRMREVGRRQWRPGPFAAHEWEPRLGSATFGAVAEESVASMGEPVGTDTTKGETR